MRFRTPLFLVLAATFAWVGCEDTATQPYSVSPQDPAFAKGGAACDTKGAPVRDYFTNKGTRQHVNELFRTLGTHCAAGEGALTIRAGFDILSAVEIARGAQETEDPADGADVVLVAWRVMQPFLCPAPADCPADRVALIGSLSLEGAFGVRSAHSDPVYSWGNTADGLPYWGIEPFSPNTWPLVIEGGIGLIVGYPDYQLIGDLNEEALATPVAYAYDWRVYPGTAGPVSVTMCADAPDEKKEKIGHGGALLQDGNDGDLLCDAIVDPLVASAGLGDQLIRLASAALPFWPQELYATVKGGSASGKATEFSPFFGYQLDPEGLVEFITIPGNATAFDPDLGIDPSGSNLICAAGVDIPAEATTCPPGSEIRVHLMTSNRSRLSGDETVFMVVTAEDNNGSWEMYGTFEGVRDDTPGVDPGGDPYGLVYSWNDLALDKPGAYKLHTYRTSASGCVFDDDGNQLVCGENSVGIAFPAASSAKFLVNP